MNGLLILPTGVHTFNIVHRIGILLYSSFSLLLLLCPFYLLCLVFPNPINRKVKASFQQSKSTAIVFRCICVSHT